MPTARKSASLSVLFASGLLAAAPAPAQETAQAARRCNAPAANNTIVFARNMTCKAAARDSQNSISVCCPASYTSAAGFKCTTTTAAKGRCVRGRKAYRFTTSE